MVSLDHPLTGEEIVGYMLAGLGAEFKSQVTSITMCDDPVSLNNSFTHLLSTKVHIYHNNSVGKIQSSTNAADR
jgi:hypothetical protein